MSFFSRRPASFLGMGLALAAMAAVETRADSPRYNRDVLLLHTRCQSAELIGHWDFEDTADGVVPDRSGNSPVCGSHQGLEVPQTK